MNFFFFRVTEKQGLHKRLWFVRIFMNLVLQLQERKCWYYENYTFKYDVKR